MNNWTEETLKQKLADNPDLSVESFERQLQEASIKPHKYHVSAKGARTYEGKVFHSKKEADHARDNDLRIKAGELSFYLMQVPIQLSQTTYRVDFIEFKQVKNTPLYEVRFVEVKGMKTPLGELKRKQAQERLGIEIEVV